jgi:TonB family protein
MRTDFLFSFLIHFILVIIMVISAPFKPQIRTDLGEIIKVSIRSMPASQEPQKIEPAAIPQPIATDEPVIAIQEMAMVTEPKKIDKPKPKPKEKKDKEYRPDADKGKTDQAGSADGKKDVTDNLGSGSKFGAASIDNASFNYPYWFTQAFSKIERNWTNPVYANQKLVCIVYFQVITSGRIIKIEIEQQSGIDAYDHACERAVKQSQPLPPLPAEFADEIIGIHLEFPYIPL